MRSITIITILFAAGLATHVFGDQLQPADPFVMGYAGQLSYVAGDTATFHISSSHSTIAVAVDRVGAERGRVFDREEIIVAKHPITDRASSDGCDWPSALSITIPSDWRSGYYEMTLTAGSADQSIRSTLFFVVRNAEPDKGSGILLQLSTNTYNAYTNWGGHSLYAYHDRDGLQGHRVSFDRPLSSLFNNWELPFVRWAPFSNAS